MNYFIDFEATQFSNEIISIGCVREDGEIFYSLVHAQTKVTKFITDLTKITPEEVAAAPAPERVFACLYDWCTNDPKPHFFCYGTNDKEFVKHNFKNCKLFKAASMLSYLYLDMEDYSSHVRQHFGLCKPISLKKVFDYCSTISSDIFQHNALNDAKMLKTVYDYIQIHESEKNVFPDYQNDAVAPELSYIVYRYEDDCLKDTFNSLGEAIKWCYENTMPPKVRNTVHQRTIARGIKKSHNENKPYRNFLWRLEQK